MKDYSFLIIHGLGGSGPDHWQSWLYNELRQRNFSVSYPTFSTFDFPNKEVWLKELSDSIQALPAHQKKVIITHSLGGILWQHFASVQNKKAADYAILVAPPSPVTVIPEAKSFYPVPLNGQKLTTAAEETLFIHSSNDPYCSMEDAGHYFKFNLPSVTLPNMGHINTESGHGKWPWILNLCLDIVEKDWKHVI